MKTIFASVFAAVFLWASGASAQQARPSLAGTLDAYVVAHEDDWQFFMGDHAGTSMLSGNKVVFVHTTAGDAGNDTSYWRAREEAAKASVDTLLGAERWTCAAVMVNAHAVRRCVKGSRVVAYFLRLPDGNSGDGFGYGKGSLRGLRDYATSVAALDRSTSYRSWSDFTATIRAILLREAGGLPVHLRAPEYDYKLNPGDHPDHTLTGDAAHTLADGQGWRVDFFVGYDIGNRPTNLKPPQVELKRAQLAAYDRVTVHAGLGASGLQQYHFRTWFRTTSSVSRARVTSATLLSLALEPDTVTIFCDENVQFNALGVYDDGSKTPANVTYSSSGGQITINSGVFTATQPGEYVVVAQDRGNGRADTARVTVLERPVTTVHTNLAGDDWRAYDSFAALQSADRFSWSEARSPYSALAIVRDTVFGQVVRLLQPTGLAETPLLELPLASKHDRLWLRWRMKVSAPGNAVADSAYDIARLLFDEKNVVRIGSDFAGLTNDWLNGEWWDFVLYYRATPNGVELRFWRRQLTAGGFPAARTWSSYSTQIKTAKPTTASSVSLGFRSAQRAAASRFFMLGPWEIVDGNVYGNPFGVY